MSDRPPLQIGYVLSQESITVADTQSLHYEILCSVVQQLWIVGLYAVLVAAGLRRLTVGPGDVRRAGQRHRDPPRLLRLAEADRRRLPARGAGAGDLAALGGSGGAIWRVGALLGALLGARHARPRRQHLRDHPDRPHRRLPRHAELALDRRRGGGRARDDGLLVGLPEVRRPARRPPVKWHLGGVTEIDDRGTLESIVDSYREAGLGGAIDNKWNNVEDIVGIARFNEDIERHRRRDRAKATLESVVSDPALSRSSSCCRCWACS